MGLFSKKDKKPKKKLDPKDVDLNRKLDGMVNTGSRWTTTNRAMTEDAINYVFGNQHKNKSRKKGWQYPAINRLYSDMIQEIAVLSANNPRIATPPRKDTSIETAKSVGQVLKGVWSEVLRMRTKVMLGLYDDHLSGFKVAKCFWNSMAEWDEEKANKTGNGWKGRLEVNIINPDYFGCDPDVELAIEIPTKARFIHTERWVDKLWAAQRWSKYKDELIKLGELDKDTGELVGEEGGGAGGRGNSTDETGFTSANAWSGRERGKNLEQDQQERLAEMIMGHRRGNEPGDQKSDTTMVRVQEIYWRDYATETVEAEMEIWPPGQGDAEHITPDPDGGPEYFDQTKPILGEDGNAIGYEQFKGEWPKREVRPKYERPKYPNGRLTIRIDEDFIVDDRPWGYKRWPFAVAPGYMLPHLWMGLNCAELMRGSQDIINTIGSHLLNFIKNYGDPSTWVEEGALAPKKKGEKGKIRNAAGAITFFVRGALGRNAAKVNPPPSLSPVTMQILDFFMGTHQDLSGVHDVAQGKASQDNTLGELEMLNRNTRQRIAMQGAMLDEWLKQIALCVIELMQRHFEVDEWVAWTGDEPEATQSAISWTQDMANATVDVLLEPVSTLPFDEEREVAKYIKAKEVAERPNPILLKEVLQKMKVQNIQETLEMHPIMGPLQILLDMAQQMGEPPQKVIAALQAQMAIYQEAGAEAGQPGQGGSQPPGPPQGGTQTPKPQEQGA